MNIVEQAEIDFHQPDLLSIFLESNSSENDEKVGEVALLSMFALRMMFNLDVCEVTDALATLLTRSEGLVPALASGQSPKSFRLIAYPGHPGRKRFILKINITDACCKFDLEVQGFDELSTGVGYYGPTAVQGLLQFLSLRRSADSDYLDCLAAAAVSCGKVQLERQISMTNQSQLGLSIIVESCETLLNNGTYSNALHSMTKDVDSELEQIAAWHNHSIRDQAQRKIETNIHRVFLVVEEYILFTTEYQLELAQAALMWAFVSLSGHDRCGECEARFYAIIDMGYVDTSDFEDVPDEYNLNEEQAAIYERASKIAERVWKDIPDIIHGAGLLLNAMHEDSPLRLTADILWPVLKQYMIHAEQGLLRQLVGACYRLSMRLNEWRSGVGSPEDLKYAYSRILEASNSVSTYVFDSIRSGRLVVVDGKIINPKHKLNEDGSIDFEEDDYEDDNDDEDYDEQ